MATTNPSASDVETRRKYENSETISATTSGQNEGSSASSPSFPGLVNSFGRFLFGVPPGAERIIPSPADVRIQSMVQNLPISDMRTKIRVPASYMTQLTQGPDNTIRKLGGIIFPYSPTIGFEHKADYSSQTPIHSNFAINFYQRSSVAPINISGKFSVSNETEAMIYVATVHLLRALTKMRSGGEADSGAPPPVCRLDSYGAFMLQNVPVAISNFKIDLPDNVDYYTLGKVPGSLSNTLYDMTSVPVVSTISISCIPMYSRDEMQKFKVSGWLTDKFVRKAGYL